MRHIFLCCLIVILGGLGVVSSASALAIYPALVDVRLAPGAVLTRTFVINNDEKVPRVYDFTVQKFIPKGEQGQQEFLPPEEKDGLPSWITFDQSSLTLKSGEKKTIAFHIRTPKDAMAGGQYGVIFISSHAQTGGSKAGITSRTGLLILAVVEGQVVERYSINSFERLSSSGLVSHLPVYFRLSLKNVGSVHMQPKGVIVIRNLFGRVSVKLPINPDNSYILPNSTRRLDIPWGKQPVVTSRGFFYALKQEWGQFALGFYTASFEEMNSHLDGSLPVQIHFSIWPWHLFIIFIVGIIILLIMLSFYRKWVIHRATVRF